jgi:hypothetical protein
MRHPSVSAVRANNSQQVREEKEKVMRKSFTAAVALVAVIATATPAVAAPSGKNAPRKETSVRERDNAPVLKAISRFLKKFGIKTQALPIGPIPDQENDGN